MNKDYPIKYAVEELIERGGYVDGYKDIIYGYIVSKCYVVQSSIIYHSNGNSSINHKVVFPYNDIALFRRCLLDGRINIGEYNFVSYDACNNPYPVQIVDNLFDTYEDARIEANKKNEELKKELIIRAMLNKNWIEVVKNVEKKFDKRLIVCSKYEEEILSNTNDIEVSKEEKGIVRVLKP